MKQTLHSSALLMLILLIVSSSKLSAHFIATKQGQEEVKFNENTSGESLVEKDDSSELMNLIGLESCDTGDEECFKRRILSEAHLDYIYTQHHKPRVYP